MRSASVLSTVSVLALLAASDPAYAQPAPDTQASVDEQTAEAAALTGVENGVFQLGQINVIGGGVNLGDGFGATSGQRISQDQVTAEQILTYNRNTLDDALAIVPGVSVNSSGGSRNEKVAYVRGFDMFKVPLTIDGVRVYLPYDNRLDLGRFITPDLAEIEVQKGYVSVLNGPGGLGGQINLVTRKPTKEVEGEIRAGLDFGNTGELATYTGFASLGTRQENYYLQASGAVRDSDGFFLSKDFDPVNLAAENGGLRDHSDVRDWRINVKAGLTPNDTDEYTINYTKQSGKKDAPYHIGEAVRTPSGQIGVGSAQRDWEWPYWDFQSIAFLSHTQVGEASYVKSKIFYSEFNNLLSAFDDNSHTTQNLGRAFDSYYDDDNYGGSVEFGTELIPMNTLKGTLQYRRDNHVSRNLPSPSDPASVFDETERYSEDTWYVALENTFHATERLDLVAGLGWSYRDLQEAFEQDLTDDDAIDWQAAAIYRLSDTGEVHASVSSRTRFPTLWERFSARFGSSIANPDLKSEKSTNYEIGWSDEVKPGLKLGAAVFYSDVTDIIQAFVVDDTGPTYQNRNIADGTYYGIELKADWQATDTLLVGGHYTFLERDLEAVESIPDIRPVGTPRHSAFLYAQWEAFEDFTITPSAEIYSSRYSANRFENSFVKNDGFAIANVTAEYKIDENFSVSGGVRNILDEDYALSDGFPEPGRNFFLTGRVTF